MDLRLDAAARAKGAMGWRGCAASTSAVRAVWHPVYARELAVARDSHEFPFSSSWTRTDITPVFIIVAGLVPGDYRYVTKENLSDTATLLYDERTTLAPATIVEGSSFRQRSRRRRSRRWRSRRCP